MKAIKITTVIFLILIVFLLFIAVAETFFGWTYPISGDFFAVNYVASVALGIFGAMCIASLFVVKFNAKKAGFYILHFGIAVFLIGCLIYKVSGEYVSVSVPINSSTYYSSIIKEDGQVLELGFEFSVTDFATDYYIPTYTVHKMSENGNEVLYESIEYDSENELFDFKEYGKYSFSRENANNVDSYPEYMNLSTDGVVAVLNLQPKQYTAFLTFDDGNNVTQKELKVNYPVYKNGYKIYLMSYNDEHAKVTLLFKKDIGEAVSTTGIILIIFGCVFHCLVYPFLQNGKHKTLKESEL